MRTTLAYGVLAIAAVGAATVAVIWWDGERPRPAPARAPARAVAPEPAPLVPGEGGAPSLPPPQPPAPVELGPSSTRRERAAAAAGRSVAGRPAASSTELLASLRLLGVRVAGCMAPRDGGAPPGTGRGIAMVRLELDQLEGRVRISSVELPDGSPPDERLLSCARSEMLGRELAVTGATPGPTTSMPLAIRY